MRLYVAGPMSGCDEWNYPAFHEAARRLRAKGYDVVSPAELDEEGHVVGSKPWEWYMRRDLWALLGCEAVAVLDGWRQSKGASLEVYVASALGMPIVDARTLEPVDETVLQEADRLVATDRQSAYGHPLDDFTRTGRMWGAILGTDDVPPETVALCMVAVKLSREVNHHKRDNLTDMAGYAKCASLVHAERERRGG